MAEIPNARDSEMALLGAILIDPNIMDKVGLETSEFYDVGHQTLYAAMRAIGSRDLDIVVLGELLERKKQMDVVGGREYLVNLIQNCPQTYNFETYERVIRDTAIRRRVIQECEALAASAFDEAKNISDAIGLSVSNLVQTAKPKGGAKHIGEYLRSLYESIAERADNPVEIYGLQTGLADFDDVTHGLQQGEEFVLAGQPGAGKSLLAFQLGVGMAEHGHAGAVYSLEMSGAAMVRRHLSAISKIKTYNMQSGVGMPEKWDSLVKAVEVMDRLPIYIADESDWTTIQMRADLSRLKQQHDIKWFIVDYHDLLGDSYGRDFIERSAYISQQLHSICKDLHLAGLVIQSLNKGGYHNPTMENLSGSTKVMHTADQIAILVVDENKPNVVELHWQKMREGETNFRYLELVKQDGFPMFYGVAREDVGNAAQTKSKKREEQITFHDYTK